MKTNALGSLLAITALAATFALGASACGQRRLAANGDVQTPYAENRTTVIGTDDNGAEVAGSTEGAIAPGDCVEVGTQCVVVEGGDFCERDGGPSDAIVVDGVVVEVVCYPPPKDSAPDVVVDADQDGDLDVPQNANNTTVTFDEATDGTPIEGNITVDGNNVAIYGNGAENTVIVGDVVLDGNNVRLRGLTIDGNLTITKNNQAVVLVVVTGFVLIEGSNDVFAANDVYGNLTVTQNNVVLVQNRVQGTFDAAGGNATCTANHAFTDENEDGAIGDDEVGDAIGCD